MSKAERKAGYANSSGAGQLQASYGMSHAQLEEVRRSQVRGNQKMVPAIGADEDYEVPAVEFLHIYHIASETPIYDQNTGDRKDRGKTIIKLNEPAFKLLENSGGFRGQKIEILHDPTRAQEWEQKRLEEDEEEKED